jgi:uncharacterized membrane protein YkvA (DUF1232 family)
MGDTLKEQAARRTGAGAFVTTPQPETERKYLDFYQKLRAKIRRTLEKERKKSTSGTPTTYGKLFDYLAFVPDFFHLVVKLLFDPATPATKRALLGAMAAYIVSPIDIIPDILPGGYLDDIIVLGIGLSQVFSGASEELKAAARRHWAGDGDVFEAVQSVASTAETMMMFLPKTFMSMVRAVLRGRTPKDKPAEPDGNLPSREEKV